MPVTGGLYDPLGTDRKAHRPGAARPSAPMVAAGLLLAGLATLLAVSYLRDTGDRGVPVAVAPIERLPPAPPVPAAAPASAAAPVPAPATSPTAAAPAPFAPGIAAARADQDVRIENGVRVVRPRHDAPVPPNAVPPASGGRTLRVPDGKAQR